MLAQWTLGLSSCSTRLPLPSEWLDFNGPDGPYRLNGWLDVGIVVWHPQYWDLHLWVGEEGTPTVSFANPKATGAGLHLPDEVTWTP